MLTQFQPRPFRALQQEGDAKSKCKTLALKLGNQQEADEMSEGLIWGEQRDLKASPK